MKVEVNGFVYESDSVTITCTVGNDNVVLEVDDDYVTVYDEGDSPSDGNVISISELQ